MSYEIPTLLSRRGRRQRVRERAHLQAMIREQHLAPSVRRAAFMFMGASQLLKLFSSSQRQRLLFDDHPGAAAGYSLRRLSWDVANAIRVRESGGNTEANIGFLGEDLDTVQLLLYTGAGSGYVTTWYDQSGNARNATQATSTAQPRIVNAGVLDTQDGKAAIYWDGNDFLWYNGTHLVADNVSAYCVASFNNNTSRYVAFDMGSNVSSNFRNLIIEQNTYLTAGQRYGFYTPGGSGGNSYDSSFSTGAGRSLLMVIASLPVGISVATIVATTGYYRNGSAGTLTSKHSSGGILALPTGNSFGIGSFNYNSASPGASSLVGYLSEVGVWHSDQSSSRTAIESNINSYWEIYP